MKEKSPTENPELLKKLLLYNENPTQDLKDNILDVLAREQVLSPISISEDLNNKNEMENLTQDKKLNLINIKDEQGNIYLPIFTDWNQIDKWNINEIKAMAFTLAEYVKFLNSNRDIYGIVINPFDHNVVFKSEEIIAYVKKSQNFIANESVKIGIPKKYPHKMVDFLKSYLKEKPLINKAYLLLMVREINNEESFLLVIDSEQDNTNYYDDISRQALPFLNKRQKLDFVSSKSEFGKSAIQEQVAFYIKEL